MNAPHSLVAEFRGRRVVMRLLVLTTIVVTALLSLLLLHSYFVAGNTYVLPRIVFAVIILAYNVMVHFLARSGKYRLAAYLLVCNYGLYAVLSVWYWGNNIPFGIVMMSLSITLAGVLLSSKQALYVAVIMCGTLLGFQALQAAGVHLPDQGWAVKPASFLDVLGHCTVLVLIGVITWLFGSQMEGSLVRARAAEEALLKQKNSLADKLEERTQKLKAAQLKEMQQLYRFAELGQLSTALLHDLANHLTVLTLNIEDINKSQHSQAIKRAQQSIFYLDRMVDQVRSQLQGGGSNTVFIVSEKIKETIITLRSKFQPLGIQVTFNPDKSVRQLQCYGDCIRFQQVLTILITNAIDAYKKSSLDMIERRILVVAHSTDKQIHISIRDWGVGIPKKERVKLFKPFYSTKEDGMGIGLFIARQMAETHFKGKISMSETEQYTEFIVVLPKVLNG